MTSKSDPNFEVKLIFCLKNDMKDLGILTRAVESLKICTWIGYFLSKVPNV